jgi:hypothetical protein
MLVFFPFFRENIFVNIENRIKKSEFVLFLFSMIFAKSKYFHYGKKTCSSEKKVMFVL